MLEIVLSKRDCFILLNHIGLFTNHPKRLLNFYEKRFGFKREYEVSLSKEIVKSIFKITKRCSMVRLSFGKSERLEIFWTKDKRLKKRRLNTTGYNHYVLSVMDRDKFTERLKSSGIKVTRINRNGRYPYFIKDPDGNLLR